MSVDSRRHSEVHRTRLFVIAMTGASGIVTAMIAQAAAPAGRYTIQGADTVKDEKTKLLWERDYRHDPMSMTKYLWSWSEADTYCKNKPSKGDWRLPTIMELETIVDRRVGQPAIDKLAFPNMPASPSYFWSASPGDKVVAGSHWAVRFDDGAAFVNPNGGDTYYVRCVH